MRTSPRRCALERWFRVQDVGLRMLVGCLLLSQQPAASSQVRSCRSIASASVRTVKLQYHCVVNEALLLVEIGLCALKGTTTQGPKKSKRSESPCDILMDILRAKFTTLTLKQCWPSRNMSHDRQRWLLAQCSCSLIYLTRHRGNATSSEW